MYIYLEASFVQFSGIYFPGSILKMVALAPRQVPIKKNSMELVHFFCPPFEGNTGRWGCGWAGRKA